MIDYLLDTNICIYLIKRKPPQVLHRLQGLDASAVGISAVTLSELEFGVENSQRPLQNRAALASFVASLEILPYEDQAAQQYGRLRADLQKKGRPIGPLDLLIAAHALSMGCVLVTNNTREFERVAYLQLEDWTV